MPDGGRPNRGRPPDWRAHPRAQVWFEAKRLELFSTDILPHRGYKWGSWTGLIGPHRFALDTVENRRLVYDVETGKLTDVIKLSPPPIESD